VSLWFEFAVIVILFEVVEIVTSPVAVAEPKVVPIQIPPPTTPLTLLVASNVPVKSIAPPLVD